MKDLLAFLFFALLVNNGVGAESVDMEIFVSNKALAVSDARFTLTTSLASKKTNWENGTHDPLCPVRTLSGGPFAVNFFTIRHMQNIPVKIKGNRMQIELAEKEQAAHNAMKKDLNSLDNFRKCTIVSTGLLLLKIGNSQFALSVLPKVVGDDSFSVEGSAFSVRGPKVSGELRIGRTGIVSLPEKTKRSDVWESHWKRMDPAKSDLVRDMREYRMAEFLALVVRTDLTSYET